MLPKPKILQGEVKEFIDISTERSVERIFTDVITFYNQPFNPEMITEYFLGWVYNGKNHYFTNGKDKIHYQKHRGFNYKGIQVKTLSQFITFTHSIKKEWRRI